MRFPLLGKALALLGVSLLLLWVLSRIEGLVGERRGRAEEARVSVEQSLASAQTLLGPLMHRSCSEEWDEVVGEGKARRKVTERRDFMLSSSPHQLQVTAVANAQPRYRGLFKVNGYAGVTEMQARWSTLAAMQPQRLHKGSRLSCDAARVMVSLSDVRGIRQAQMHLDDVPAPVLPGTDHPRFVSGMHAEVVASRLEQIDVPLTLRLRLDLIGTARLALVPLGEQTRWELRSDWPHPSFGGRFLPSSRDISDRGFSAQWTVSALASDAARQVHRQGVVCPSTGLPEAVEAARDAVAGQARGPCLDTLEVTFIDPVNPYSLSDRAIKYALLFITLTLAAVALTEVLSRRRVHPVQYALVGLAMALFFLLLLSLSEHVSFDTAYAVASSACVALLAVYAAAMLGSRRSAALFAAGVALLYGVLWLLLKMEQTALVLGSVLLFATLAAVMVLTRRVDWYGLAAHWRPGTP